MYLKLRHLNSRVSRPLRCSALCYCNQILLTMHDTHVDLLVETRGSAIPEHLFLRQFCVPDCIGISCIRDTDAHSSRRRMEKTHDFTRRRTWLSAVWLLVLAPDTGILIKSISCDSQRKENVRCVYGCVPCITERPPNRRDLLSPSGIDKNPILHFHLTALVTGSIFHQPPSGFVGFKP